MELFTTQLPNDIYIALTPAMRDPHDRGNGELWGPCGTQLIDKGMAFYRKGVTV